MKVYATHSVWANPAAAARLDALWKSSTLTMTEIAEILSREFDLVVSRNAVVGKLQRLGLFGKGGSKPTITPSQSEAERSTTITLPSVGARYAFSGGWLIRDGIALEARQS